MQFPRQLLDFVAVRNTFATATLPRSTYAGRWQTASGRIAVDFKDRSKIRNNYTVFDYQGTPALKLYVPGGKPVYYLKR